MKRLAWQGVLFFVMTMFSLFIITNVFAQESGFPLRPINLHVGFSAGGGVALTTQVISEGMKKYLKQPVMVNFKSGAAQAIAAEFTKNSAPDGYNLFAASFEPLIAKVVLDGPTLKFTLDDFDTLGAGPYIVHMMAVNSESRWKNFEELMNEARKSPGKFSLGHVGVGTSGYMKGMLLCQETGVEFNQIPYSGAGPVVTSLLGKHIDVGMGSFSSMGPHLKAGTIRGMLILDKKRNAEIPDVPTAVEKGINIISTDHFGLVGPKGLPSEVRNILAAAYKKTIEDPEIVAVLGKISGVGISYLSPRETRQKINDDYKTFIEIWKKVGGIK